MANGVADTVITAKVYRKGEEVTDEYAATAFNWTRISGDESADASWNAAHSGMKSITVSANELSDDIQIQCTLTGTSSSYGSVDVNEQFIASHTRGVADSNDTLSIEDGTLFVTTDDDNYRLSGNELKALYPRLNGSVTANAWVYHAQPTKTIEFKYNSASLRVQKKVTANGKSETTDYTLHGKLVTHMTVGNDNLHFFYDAQSRPTKVNFNGTTYTYLHNLQGDAVGIIDNSDNLVVEYKYDAWGRLLSIVGLLADTIGKCNPFLYRCYIYDMESGLYYLQRRYYCSDRMRFINPDTILASYQGISGANVFSYCDNSPAKRVDASGDFWNQIVAFCNKVKDAVVQAAESVKECIEETFSVAVYVEDTRAKGVDLGLAKLEYGVTMTELVYGNDDRPIVFYRKDSKGSHSWGVCVNVGKASTSFEAGTDGLNLSVGYDGASYDMTAGLLENGSGVSKSVSDGKTTITHFARGYIRPWAMALAAVAIYSGVAPAVAFKVGVTYLMLN